MRSHHSATRATTARRSSSSARHVAPAAVPANYFQPFILEGSQAYYYAIAPIAERRRIREQVELAAKTERTRAMPAVPRLALGEDIRAVRVRRETLDVLELSTLADRLGVQCNTAVASNTTLRGSTSALAALADELVILEIQDDLGRDVTAEARRLRVRIDAVLEVTS